MSELISDCHHSLEWLVSSKLWNPVLAVDGIGVNNLERGDVENCASQILWINVRETEGAIKNG